MKILDRIETSVEAFVEGLFRRKLTRKVQPIEIGKHLIKIMDENKQISIVQTYVPNQYVIYLNPELITHFQAMKNTLCQELKGVLQTKAEKEKLSLIGELTIEFEEDDDLGRGDIKISADYVEQADNHIITQTNFNTNTIVFEGLDADNTSKKFILVLEQNNGTIKEISILKNKFSIGRSSQCDLTLNDNNVSRIHTFIIQEAGTWLVSDNNSTNGTLVNGEQIDRHPIQDGDILQVGTTTLRLKELRN